MLGLAANPFLKASPFRRQSEDLPFDVYDLSSPTIIDWDPSNVANLWLDAAMTSPSTADGDLIKAVSNAAGASEATYDAIQAADNLRVQRDDDGLNGRPCIVNNGTGWLRRATTPADAQPFTIFIVYQHTSVVASSFILDGGGGTTNRTRFNLDASSRRGMNGGTALGYTVVEDTDPHIFEGLFDTTESEFYIDGVARALGTAGTITLEGLTLFASRVGAGIANAKIGRVLVFAGALTGHERLMVRRMLALDFGLSVNLSSVHYSISAASEGSYIGNGTQYEAWETSDFSDNLDFRHLRYEQSASPTTAVIEDVVSGNTTRSLAAFRTSGRHVEIPVIAQFFNNFVLFADGRQILGPDSRWPTVQNDGLTYRLRIQFATDDSRLIEVGLRGQSLGVKLPQGHTATLEAHTGARCLLVGDSWAQGTGAAMDTDDPFGNSQPGCLWLSGPMQLARRLGLNPLNAAKGGTGWVNPNEGVHDENYLQRITAELALVSAGDYDAFMLVGSGNDKDEDLETVASNLSDGIALCRAHNALAPILVVGPGWWDDEPAAEWQLLEDAMIAQMLIETAADPLVSYISVKDWMGVNREHQAEYIHTGGSHPNRTGHGAWADFVQDAARSALESVL